VGIYAGDACMPQQQKRRKVRWVTSDAHARQARKGDDVEADVGTDDLRMDAGS
jgi:hypothetical protein